MASDPVLRMTYLVEDLLRLEQDEPQMAKRLDVARIGLTVEDAWELYLTAAGVICDLIGQAAEQSDLTPVDLWQLYAAGLDDEESET